MRIGLDIDDTICQTTEMVHEVIEKYASKVNLNLLDIMNDDFLRDEFYDNNSAEIFKNVIIKKEVKDIFRRLNNKGNKIYIITSRKKEYESITRSWFEKEGLEVEEMIFSVYGEDKAKTCQEKHIDLMIEDNPYNYKKIKEAGIHCILYDDRGKYDLKQDYYTTWNDIEDYIERNH